MAYAKADVIIDAKLDEVFNFILDGENNKLWRPRVNNIIYNNQQKIDVGTIFKQEMLGFPGVIINADYQIIECNRYRKISFLILNGPYKPVGSFDFEQRNNGVKVTFSMDEPGVESTERDRHFQNVVNDVVNLNDYFKALNEQ